MVELREEIENAINRTSSENESNTPDFILAEYLMGCLNAFDKATGTRDRWYGIAPEPGQATQTDRLIEIIGEIQAEAVQPYENEPLPEFRLAKIDELARTAMHPYPSTPEPADD